MQSGTAATAPSASCRTATDRALGGIAVRVGKERLQKGQGRGSNRRPPALQTCSLTTEPRTHLPFLLSLRVRFGLGCEVSPAVCELSEARPWARGRSGRANCLCPKGTGRPALSRTPPMRCLGVRLCAVALGALRLVPFCDASQPGSWDSSRPCGLSHLPPATGPTFVGVLAPCAFGVRRFSGRGFVRRVRATLPIFGLT